MAVYGVVNCNEAGFAFGAFFAGLAAVLSACLIRAASPDGLQAAPAH